MTNQIAGLGASAVYKPSHISFAGVSIGMEPPHTVTLDPGVTFDQAARRFWNAVCRIMGQPLPFPQEEAMPSDYQNIDDRLIDAMLAAQSRFVQTWCDGACLTDQQRKDETIRDAARARLLEMIGNPA